MTSLGVACQKCGGRMAFTAAQSIQMIVDSWNRRADGTEKIEIGDEVRGKDVYGNVVFVVTRITKDGWLYGIGHDGIPYLDREEKYFEKTGRHYDIIEAAVRELAEDTKEGEDR